MSRSKQQNPVLCKEIGTRFVRTIQDFDWTLAKASRELGYANPVTLQAIKRGEALPSIEKLVIASNRLKSNEGMVMDLHWVLTGHGSAFYRLRPQPTDIHSDEDIMIIINRLSQEKKDALISILMKL